MNSASKPLRSGSSSRVLCSAAESWSRTSGAAAAAAARARHVTPCSAAGARAAGLAPHRPGGRQPLLRAGVGTFPAGDDPRLCGPTIDRAGQVAGSARRPERLRGGGRRRLSRPATPATSAAAALPTSRPRGTPRRTRPITSGPGRRCGARTPLRRQGPRRRPAGPARRCRRSSLPGSRRIRPLARRPTGRVRRCRGRRR